jgi:tRNA pseudouridine(55) synthase
MNRAGIAFAFRPVPIFDFMLQYKLSMSIPRYIMLEKKVGQTPLACAEVWRSTQPPQVATLPLAYAGRLDPMASGKLLVLIGDECKQQERYHALDKAYEFSVLCGIGSDTGDVLGRLTSTTTIPAHPSRNDLLKAISALTGPLTLPYPVFSSKTVKGKPLHTWALEGRLDEIEIPHQASYVYKLTLTQLETKTRGDIYAEALAKVNSIPPVTDARKAIGNDFRRVDIREDWLAWSEAGSPTDTFPIAHFICIARSGAYMRSLAEEIGRQVGTPSLAYHIHRTTIGHYQPLPFHQGFWTTRY